MTSSFINKSLLYLILITVSIVFWQRFQSQIRPTRLAINFLFIIVRAKRKVLYGAKLFDFFLWVNIHTFDLKPVAFYPKFSGDSWIEFMKQTILGEYFKKFVQTKAILYRNL